MDINIIIILMCLLFIPTILLIVVGIYYVSVKGVVKLLIRIQELGNEYREKRIQTMADKEDLKRRKELAQKRIDEAKRQKEAETPKWYEQLYMFSINHYIASALIASIIAAVLFSVIVFVFDCIHPECCYIRQYVTDNERLILVFVGILATFVVISNYSQVSSAEQRITKSQEELRLLTQKQQSANIKVVNDMNAELQKMKSNNLFLTYRFIEACQDNVAYTLGSMIARNIVDEENKFFDIVFVDNTGNRTSIKAKILIEKNELIFRIKEGRIDKDNFSVDTINGYKYVKDKVEIIASNLADIYKMNKRTLTK